MKIYFPESKQNIDYVGYNHAASLLGKTLTDWMVDDPAEADFSIYCNLPWHANPDELKRHKLPILAYTMIESTKLPNSWVKFLNKHITAVLTPTQWCAEVFKSCGVKIPIFVLPLCYDEERIPDVVLKSEYKNCYVYLWQGVSLDRGCSRKGYDIVVKAFDELKKERRIGSDALLILKTVPQKEAPLEMNVKNLNDIMYIQKILSPDEMQHLYAKTDCCINPTHGEGFGFIPLEQMAMGKPVLVTGYNIPYMNSGCMSLAYDLEKSPVKWIYKHVAISLNGISINSGGLPKSYSFLPEYIRLKPNGSDIIELLHPSVQAKLLSKKEILKNKINNFFHYVQKALRLYENPKRRVFYVLKERGGYDAHVRIDDLKDKMEWCYKNRSEAEDLGFMAAQYVRRHWGKFIIKETFENLIPELEKLKNGISNKL